MKCFIKPKNGYTSLHDVAMVIREKYVYNYNNAKMFGQGSLFHSLNSKRKK